MNPVFGQVSVPFSLFHKYQENSISASFSNFLGVESYSPRFGQLQANFPFLTNLYLHTEISTFQSGDFSVLSGRSSISYPINLSKNANISLGLGPSLQQTSFNIEDATFPTVQVNEPIQIDPSASNFGSNFIFGINGRIQFNLDTIIQTISQFELYPSSNVDNAMYFNQLIIIDYSIIPYIPELQLNYQVSNGLTNLMVNALFQFQQIGIGPSIQFSNPSGVYHIGGMLNFAIKHIELDFLYASSINEINYHVFGLKLQLPIQLLSSNTKQSNPSNRILLK